jgi:hypothetical protein
MILEIKDLVLQEESDERWEVSVDIPSLKEGDADFQVNVMVAGNTLSLVDVRVDEEGKVRLRVRKWMAGEWATLHDTALHDSAYSEDQDETELE